MRGLERVMLVVSTTESKPVEPGQLLLFLLLLLYAEYIRCSFRKIIHLGIKILTKIKTYF